MPISALSQRIGPENISTDSAEHDEKNRNFIPLRSPSLHCLVWRHVVFAGLKTRPSLAAVQVRAEIFSEQLSADRAIGILLYTIEKEGDVDIQARMFAPLVGVSFLF
jgi:hypothetical protein